VATKKSIPGKTPKGAVSEKSGSNSGDNGFRGLLEGRFGADDPPGEKFVFGWTQTGVFFRQLEGQKVNSGLVCHGPEAAGLTLRPPTDLRFHKIIVFVDYDNIPAMDRGRGLGNVVTKICNALGSTHPHPNQRIRIRCSFFPGAICLEIKLPSSGPPPTPRQRSTRHRAARRGTKKACYTVIRKILYRI
jgi:hypothetical protein